LAYGRPGNADIVERMCAPAMVELELDSTAESVSLVRAGLKGLAGALELDPELLDDLQMAASEACNNVVMHAYPAEAGPLTVAVTATSTWLELVVRDRGAGIVEPAEPTGLGLGLPLIRSLTDDLDVTSIPGEGTHVRMTFEREIAILGPDPHLEPVRGRAASDLGLTGVIAGTVQPVAVLPAVLGRLARAVAAQARFSIERFMDVHLVVDSLVGLAQRFASNTRISFALRVDTRRLRLTIGPLRQRRGRVTGAPGSGELEPLLESLVDEVTVEALDSADVLTLTMTERGLAHSI
jgi:serine/threonine-protein kinase RsbW